MIRMLALVGLLLVSTFLAGASPSGAAGAARDGLIAFTRPVCPPETSGPLEDCSSQIYVVQPDGTGVRALTNIADWENPAWSPDGSEIAFDHAEYGIFVKNVNGRGQRKLCGTTQPRAPECGTFPAWSPDGRRVAFVRHQGVGGGIAILDLARRRITVVPRTQRAAYGGLEWSPDGKRFAFEGAGSGVVGIGVVNVDGSGLRFVARGDDALSPHWSPDGKTLLFLRDGVGYYTVDLAVGKPKLVLRQPNPRAVFDDADWSADGTRIAYGAGNGLHILDLHSHQDRRITLHPNVCDAGVCGEIDWQRLANH